MSGAKRILAVLVAAAVLLMATAALAEDTKINISAGEAGADGTITVTISLSGDTSVAGAQLALDYDETMLELVKVKNGSMVSGGISAMTKNPAALYSYGARLWAANSRANFSNSRSAPKRARTAARR